MSHTRQFHRYDCSCATCFQYQQSQRNKGIQVKERSADVRAVIVAQAAKVRKETKA